MHLPAFWLDISYRPPFDAHSSNSTDVRLYAKFKSQLLFYIARNIGDLILVGLNLTGPNKWYW